MKYDIPLITFSFSTEKVKIRGVAYISNGIWQLL